MPKVAPIVPITFAVIHDDVPAEVTLDFSSNADVMSFTRWRIPNVTDEGLCCRGADAKEFAQLAAKRWRHYRDTDTAAMSLAELRQMIKDDPHGEYCFHLKITADWFPASLGGAMARRTWCNHLMIDFLFAHPQICSRVVNVKMIGLNLLRAVCLIAKALDCKRVWGEATHDSAAFYQYHLGAPIEDMFILEKPVIHQFAVNLAAVQRQP
ncbi:MAG: hypothetical protein ABL962_08275 [Fimbriimonadaceae bacterium]